jgi:hypothetical protein
VKRWGLNANADLNRDAQIDEPGVIGLQPAISLDSLCFNGDQCVVGIHGRIRIGSNKLGYTRFGVTLKVAGAIHPTNFSMDCYFEIESHVPSVPLRVLPAEIGADMSVP